MQIDLTQQKLPQTYKRQGKDCYLDPIRKKLIFITPEETVRQQVISYLVHELHVPAGMIAAEAHLSHYGLSSRCRADLVVHRYDAVANLEYPVAVVECKAPNVPLTNREANQVCNYANHLGCDYVMLTNGRQAIYYKYDQEAGRYLSLDSLPQYPKMLDGAYSPLPEENPFVRVPFERLEETLSSYRDMDIGTSTINAKAIPALNLWEGLLDTTRTMPCGKYGIFDLIEDYGVRILSYGNASGGRFDGPYRSFVIKYHNSTEFVSIGFSTYATSAKPNYQRTSLNVAIDNEKSAHHALQLVLDDNLAIFKNTCSFYHHGRIAVGNQGSGKVDGLRNLISECYPKIIKGNQFFLGSLVHDHLWSLDQPEVISLVENLTSYALLRDEYRNYVKQVRKN